ncbi:hypothetical protein [Pseudoalteromonas phenolica]|uniref:hypothetical protein n=1 Tax=Pseudoalteromonas phenolica TaxID=161398 RepID=UPI00197F6EFB|nr:hypothetical protein [Pseudoalteromonas phenolica]
MNTILESELNEIVEVLSHQKVYVEKGGLWNVKAPDPVLFTSTKFKITNELEELALKNSSLILKENFIGIVSKRLSIVFE